jgi:hypothetical protein
LALATRPWPVASALRDGDLLDSSHSQMCSPIVSATSASGFVAMASCLLPSSRSPQKTAYGRVPKSLYEFPTAASRRSLPLRSRWSSGRSRRDADLGARATGWALSTLFGGSPHPGPAISRCAGLPELLWERASSAKPAAYRNKSATLSSSRSTVLDNAIPESKNRRGNRGIGESAGGLGAGLQGTAN